MPRALGLPYGGLLFFVSEAPLHATALTDLISDHAPVKWFLSSHPPHNAVNLLFTMFTNRNSKQQVDDFLGELTVEKPFNQHIVCDKTMA